MCEEFYNHLFFNVSNPFVSYAIYFLLIFLYLYLPLQSKFLRILAMKIRQAEWVFCSFCS